MINKSFEFKIGVIGLGYVGTPLACLFSKKYDTWGYDIKAEKVAKLAKSTMTDNKIVCKALEQGLKLTSSIDDLKKCNVYIIAVPTPVNKSNKPDISCVRNATAEVGKILKEGDIVVYESTVYPGLTEEVCAPLLASTSGLKLNQSFFVGFSPERINPGDTVSYHREHRKGYQRFYTRSSSYHRQPLCFSTYPWHLQGKEHQNSRGMQTDGELPERRTDSLLQRDGKDFRQDEHQHRRRNGGS